MYVGIVQECTQNHKKVIFHLKWWMEHPTCCCPTGWPDWAIFWRFFTLDSFFIYRKSTTFCAAYFRGKSCVLILVLNALGYILGNVFRNLFGRLLPDDSDAVVHSHFCGNTDSAALVTRVARWFLFRPKNTNLGIFWRTLGWKMLLYILIISNILPPLGIFYGHFVTL
jgi:uncharacterized membrane protein YqaE (UPF0057 family)